jgi:hypothetical protein
VETSLPPQELPGRVIIRRHDESDVRQRQVVVRIDGGENVQLMFGESSAHDVVPGPHHLHANNTLVWKKVAFTVAPGGRVEFDVINRASRYTLGFLALLGVAPLFLTIKQRPLL